MITLALTASASFKFALSDSCPPMLNPMVASFLPGRVNTTSESTKTLRNFIELLRWIVEFPSFFANAPAQQLSKTTAIGPTPATAAHAARKTCSYLQLNTFHLLLGFSILLHCDHDGCRMRNSSRLGRDHD